MAPKLAVMGRSVQWENPARRRTSKKNGRIMSPKLARIIARAPVREFKKKSLLKFVSFEEYTVAAKLTGSMKPSSMKGTTKQTKRTLHFARIDAVKYLLDTPKGMAHVQQVWRHLFDMGYDLHKNEFSAMMSELVQMGAFDKLRYHGVKINDEWVVGNKDVQDTFLKAIRLLLSRRPGK